MKNAIGITVAAAFLLLIVGSIKACDDAPQDELRKRAELYAGRVVCAKGYKDACWCFIPHSSFGIAQVHTAMAWAPDELCNEKEQQNGNSRNSERRARGSRSTSEENDQPARLDSESLEQ